MCEAGSSYAWVILIQDVVLAPKTVMARIIIIIRASVETMKSSKDSIVRFLLPVVKFVVICFLTAKYEPVIL